MLPHISSINPEPLLDWYAHAAVAAGCAYDQIRNLLSAGICLQPRQLAACAAARLCDRNDGPTAIGYGGARGGGKSHWLLAQMGADDCQRVAGLKCLLLRKVGKANLEHFEDLRRRLFGRLPHDFHGTRGILTFPNGSRIIAGHFQNEKDVDAYLGLEYDIIGIEEATTLTARKFQDIVTCCRTSKVLPDGALWRPRIYSTTNPGNVGHAWYKSKFIRPYETGCESDTRFIPARVTDNPFVNREYATQLASQTGWQQAAWYYGSWDIAAGQFFTNFRRELHVIEKFEPALAREWFGAFDYGFRHYTVFLLGCTDGDGNLYIVDEHAARFALPATHAEQIKNLCARHGLRLKNLRRIVAGTDVTARHPDGTSAADQYRALGIRFFPANMERITGWAEMLRRFGDAEKGIRSSLFIHKRCTRLIDCIPTLQHDPGCPEDVLKADVDDNGEGGDDTADALRYMVATKAGRVEIVKLRGM